MKMENLRQAMFLILMLLVGINGICASEQSEDIQISSPDKHLTVKVFTLDNRLSYSITFDSVQIIKTSPLGLTVDSIDLGNNANILSSPVLDAISEDYLIIGNHTVARNHANEAKIPLEASGREFNLIVRAYNDGVAIRYTIPEGAKCINSESTSWNLPENITKIAWSGFSQYYENLSHVTTIDSIPQNKPVMGPLTIKTGNFYISVSEADCESFSDMAFVRKGNTFEACFPFAKQGWEIQPLADNSPLFSMALMMVKKYRLGVLRLLLKI